MNASCELFIYQNCKILKNKNFKVDNISDYLSTLETLNKTDAQTNLPIAIQGQFMKHQLKLAYIIELKQTTLENVSVSGQDLLDYHEDYNYNYLCAINKDTNNTNVLTFRKVYYFITGKKWVGENSIQLELEMDVINTLIDNYGGGENYLELSPKTTILRQHKDRFERRSTSTISAKIDFYSENIFPMLFKTKESTMRDIGYNEATMLDDDLSWYLIYKAQSTNENSPIDIFVCSDEQKVVSGNPGGYSGERDPVADLSGMNAWYIYGGDRDGTNYNTGASISFTARDGQHTLTLTSSQCVIIEKRYIYLYSVGSTGSTEVAIYRAPAFKRFRKVIFNGVYVVRKSTYHADNQLTTLTPTIISGFSVDSSFPTGQQDQTIGAISEIDRTDPTLLKIIKLPYCPINLIQSGGDLGFITLPANWGVKQGTGSFPTLIHYTHPNLTEAFRKEVELHGSNASLPNPYFNIFTGPTNNQLAVLNSTRDDNWETKLKHSDYFQRKFVYDSFAYIFRAEYMNYQASSVGTWMVVFYTTATMNSKMYFRFYDEGFVADISAITLKTDIQDYSGILYIARNNELPIFNSAFLNYIRTGYNYDVKTKNRQLASNIVGGVLSTAGAVVSAVAGGPVGVAGAVALGIGATTKFYNAISQTAQAEQNIQKQLKSSEMQGLSVIGGDDVDLMSEFTDGNKAKLVQYEVSEKMKKCLADLFYYCGYIGNFQGVPDVSSRVWFNFVQADVVYNYEQNFTQELVDELTKKYNEGITYLHCVDIYVIEQDDYVSHWNFEQDKENWEKSILPKYKAVANTESTDYKSERVVRRNIDLGISTVSTITSTNKQITIRMRDPQFNLIKEVKNVIRFGFRNGVMFYQTEDIDHWTYAESISFEDYADVHYFWTIQASSYTSIMNLQNIYDNTPTHIELDED